MPGDARRVAHILRAHHALDAVGADQRRAVVDAAALVNSGDAGLALLDALDARGGEELDLTRGLLAFEQRAVYVDAVDDGVRVAEALAEGRAGGDLADQGLVDGVVHDHAVREDGAAAGEVAHAHGVEGVEGVGSELNAGADLADLGRLLQHLDAETLAHQGQRRGQATDAATGYQHGQGSLRCVHVAILEDLHIRHLGARAPRLSPSQGRPPAAGRAAAPPAESARPRARWPSATRCRPAAGTAARRGPGSRWPVGAGAAPSLAAAA